MTDSPDRSSSGPDGTTESATMLKGPTGVGTSPETRGQTTIADGVVAKIAGMSAREVPGIHSLGAGMTRAIGAVRERVPGSGSGGVSRGVKVEVGERQAALDIDVVVEYGFPIVEVASEVRVNVISAVERMTGLEVVEVNLVVDDVNLPDEDDDEPGEGRVQ